MSSSPDPANLDLRGSPIKEAERLVARTPGALSLALGNAPFPPPRAVVAALRRALEVPETWRYTPPEGLPELREAIAEQAAEDGTCYDPETEVLVTCGATEALSATLLALLSPGDEVLMPSPAYVSFASAVSLARAAIVRVPLAAGVTGFRLDLDALERAVGPRSRAIVLANPSNPTGLVLSDSELAGLLAVAERHHLQVILDEVYRYTVYEGCYVSAGTVPGAKNRLVRLFGFGKTYGMCGQRVGYVLAPATLARRILATHDALANSAPHPGQLAALAALRHCRDTRDGLADRLRPHLDSTLSGLEMLPDLFVSQPPQATWFLFPALKPTSAFGRNDREFVRRVFESTRVALLPGSDFGPQGEGHVRLSFGVPPERREEALGRLLDALLAGTPAGTGVPSATGTH
jgi:aminotransferase